MIYYDYLCIIRTTNNRLWNSGKKKSHICLCLPPDRAWHKVYDPKANYSGDLGRSWLGTSQSSNLAGLCSSSTHLVQCESNEPSWSWTQIWVQTCAPQGPVLYMGVKGVNNADHTPNVAQPKLGALRPQVCHCSFSEPRSGPKPRWTRKISFIVIFSFFVLFAILQLPLLFVFKIMFATFI